MALGKGLSFHPPYKEKIVPGHETRIARLAFGIREILGYEWRRHTLGWHRRRTKRLELVHAPLDARVQRARCDGIDAPAPDFKINRCESLQKNRSHYRWQADLISTLVKNDYITGETMTIDAGLTMRIAEGRHLPERGRRNRRKHPRLTVVPHALGTQCAAKLEQTLDALRGAERRHHRFPTHDVPQRLRLS